MRKVLVANRGEIAVRIIRACHDLGLQTVAVYSEADAQGLHVFYADEAICIGPAPSSQSYLKSSNILSACEVTGADAIHPGYGFLAENAHFASICESCGVNFIGPSSESIEALGDKARAKATARAAKCPVIPGSKGVVRDLDEAEKEAEKLGFPVFIKAVAGGGGRGIRIAHNFEDFRKMFVAARTEADISFGNPDVYLERMIMNPRHIEVQILGDKKGNYLHLGERDCTMQRRRQKLIEESPSPVVTPKLRKKLGESAIAIAKAAGYYSAGTVEFLLDGEGNFYFMEMNTRIQVEHTVSEELTGIDLIRQQILIAMGETLPCKQKDVQFNGHIIQLRINAESPAKGFMPSPGHLTSFVLPGGPHVRVDTGCYAGYTIPPFYDSMIAKLIVRGKTRQDAIATAKRALREFYIEGVESTIPFHLYMMDDPAFNGGRAYDLAYVDALIERGEKFERPNESCDI
ncbi:MAG: acetyl-CoA carboxylase biotin carboxylase subunit [Verrucomicrobia bacterium]|nr:acetyl-CoA carboxylase biotin carboxylase subunit [Verrucomicrobiota bacterium]